MCGIAGIIDLDEQRPIDEAVLAAMRDRLRHRGPDDMGTHCEPGLGFAHRRLSIIDPNGGAQPCYNEDRSVVAVYNGEIYNYRELTRDLTARGHSFRSHCDAEVVVHAWEEWGEDCVRRFHGMFAFALWDRGRRTALLARDRFGIKPLYVAESGANRYVFASELKGVLAHPEVSREIDPMAVEEYFAFGYVPSPRTVFQGIAKLLPAHVMAIRAGEPARLGSYWDVGFDTRVRDSEEDIAAELAQRLRRVVAKHMVADVPLGTLLSGGLDSSAVTAMAAAESSAPVASASIGFREPRFDESHFASQVARHCGTLHHGATVDAADLALLDDIVDLYDEPFADASAIPTYRLCEYARQWMKVALSGDGGDECHAGYRRHRMYVNEERVRARLPQGVRDPLFGLLGRIYPKADWAPRPLRAKSTFQALSGDSVDGYFRGISMLPDDLRRRMFSDPFAKRLGGYRAVEALRRHADRAPADALSRAQYLDLKSYLEGDILTKVDRASMACSLEVRVPMLDHELVEWVASLPPSARLHRGEGKRALRRALEPYLPVEIRRRPKMGFEIPLAAWLRGPLRERMRQVCSSPALCDSGIFDASFLGRMVAEHGSGRRNFQEPLWALLVFESFLRRL